MKISGAAQLISDALIGTQHPSVWCDLGCGGGTFTYALASLLAPHSKIYAVDKSFQFLKESFGSNVKIDFRQADFDNGISTLSGLDGILMANSLHYVADKERLIEQLKNSLSAEGVFLIVEYDTRSVNPWVPYPIDYLQLKQLFWASGFKNIEKLSERNSIYGRTKMYSCIVKP